MHWTEQTLLRALPNVRVSRSRSGCYPLDRASDRPCPTESVPTRQFLAELHAGPQGSYVHGEVLPEALATDCPLPQPLLAGESVARRSLWISSGGACSPLHYDLPAVLLCQLHGRKRVWLYSPSHHDRMRPLGATFPALTAHERIAATSRADLNDLDGYYVELQPGDALLMPSGWWHEVVSLGEPPTQHDAPVGGGGERGLCVSVGINWPNIADAIPSFAQWREYVKTYPLLTQGQVLASYYGEAAAASAPGYSLPVFG